MDKTPEYIKQCEKAKQLRDKWIPHEYDDVYSARSGVHKLSEGVLLMAECVPFGGINRIRADFIPLFRQDQLQEMIEDYKSSLNKVELMCAEVNQFVEKFWASHPSWLPDTMEQLWLAFVMSERYSKQWSIDKQEWVEKC